MHSLTMLILRLFLSFIKVLIDSDFLPVLAYSSKMFTFIIKKSSISMRMSSSRYVSASFMDLRFTLGELAIRSHSAFSGVAITNAYPSFSMLDSPIENDFLGMYVYSNRPNAVSKLRECFSVIDCIV